MPRVLLIGWDGADCASSTLLERVTCPTSSLITRGQKAVLRSTVLTHSRGGVAVLLTGSTPDHGVYDILETVPGTHKQYSVTYKSIGERTFVEDLSAAGKVGVYADVPLMFPPRTSRKIVAGGVLPKGRQASHPADLLDTLGEGGRAVGHQRHVLDNVPHRPEPYLAEVHEITGKRIRATEWLMDNSDWDLMASVWVSVDRTQHARSTSGPITRTTQTVTAPARRFATSTSNSTTIGLLVPLHARTTWSCSSATTGSNRSRARCTWTTCRSGSGTWSSAPRTWRSGRCSGRRCARSRARCTTCSASTGRSSRCSVNWSKTKAYTTIRSTGEGVSINSRDASADGTVDPADFEKVRDEVMDRLSSFVDPETGTKPVKAITGARRSSCAARRHRARHPDGGRPSDAFRSRTEERDREGRLDLRATTGPKA